MVVGSALAWLSEVKIMDLMKANCHGSAKPESKVVRIDKLTALSANTTPHNVHFSQ